MSHGMIMDHCQDEEHHLCPGKSEMPPGATIFLGGTHCTCFCHEFAYHAAKWQADTMINSSPLATEKHASYQACIKFGMKGVPFMLRQMEISPQHWFMALRKITGEDPAKDCDTIEAATQAWIAWGYQKGLLP